jgi:hypothetical protein
MSRLIGDFLWERNQICQARVQRCGTPTVVRREVLSWVEQWTRRTASFFRRAGKSWSLHGPNPERLVG